MDLAGLPAAPIPPRGAGPRRRHAAGAPGLFALIGVLMSCGGPHSTSPSDERVAAALVDSCRGVADGALCNDQNTCTVGDRCAGGLCVGTLAPDGTSCTDNNQCTVTDLCFQGVCKGTLVAEGTLCTDGEPCTDPDVCHLGQCTPGPPASCDDSDQCTVDRCQEGEGCRHDRILTCADAGMTGDGAAGGAGDGGSADGAGTDAVDAGFADASDGPIDGAGADLSTFDGGAADAAADGSDAADAQPDSGSDAGGDDGGDAGTVDVARVYEARGGACVCSSAPGGPPPASGLVVALVLALLRARGRRLRPDR